jgi:hypothetical protein
MVQINHPHHSSSIDSFNIYCHYQLILVKQSSILRKLKKWDDLFELWSKTENGHFLFTLLKKYSPQKTYLELEKKITSEINQFKKDKLLFERKVLLLKNIKFIKSWSHQDLTISLISDQSFKMSHLKKMEQSLSFFKTYLPDSLERLFTFTHSIIPISDKKLVSFSREELPGYSYLNLSHRDEIDLLDDLLHENGHHHLNAILRIKPLFNENNDLLFFSPWRRSLRPLRGIFHGYFTFFWAYLLFFEINKLILIDKIELPTWVMKQKAKIQMRLFEEKMMLEISYNSLLIAHQNNLLYKDGVLLIHSLNKMIKSHDQINLKIFNTLSLKDKNKLKNLKRSILSFKEDRI